MGKRVYLSNINAQSIGTPVQDIWSLLAGSAIGIYIHRIKASNSGVTTVTQINVRLKRGTATVTQGSGGSTPAKNINQDGDTKARFWLSAMRV